MQKNAPRKLARRVAHAFQHDHGMCKDIALRVKRGRLFNTVQGIDFRQNDAQDSELAHQFERTGGMRAEQHFLHLVAHPFGGKDGKFFRVTPGGVARGGIKFKTEPDGETDRPQNPEIIFRKAAVRISYGAQDSAMQISNSADMVEHLAGHGIAEESIHRKIAADDIQNFVVRVMHGFGAAAVHVVAFLAQSRNFKTAAVLNDGDDAERGAYGIRFFKNPLYLLRGRGSRDIDIVRGSAEQHVAHTAADEKRFFTMTFEFSDNFRSLRKKRGRRQFCFHKILLGITKIHKKK